MSEAASWMIVGPGNIGTELQRQVGQDYVAERLGLSQLPSYIVRSAGVRAMNGNGPVDSVDDIPDELFPDVMFVAMPSTDDGEVATSYINHALERGKLVVTAEKGAMANNFEEMRDNSNDFTRLGVNATVGGGTRMLEATNMYAVDPDNITQIHLALNGTLSAIFGSISTGMSLGQAVHQAVELGYAEPGAASPNDVIKGEAQGDIPKKTAILFNKLGLSEELIDWNDLKFELQDDQISEAVEEANIRRFIVSLYSKGYLEKNNKRCPESDAIGGFKVDHAGWRLVGGFRNTKRNPLFEPLAKLTGPNNGLVIGLGPNETDGVYAVSGPGAGVRPTVNTMLDDYVSLARRNKDVLLQSR